MNRNTLGVLAAAMAAVCAAGCGGTTAGIPDTGPRPATTMAALATGASTQRAYIGMDNQVTLGAAPVLATMDLLGGSKVELEVVTPDGSPVRFEVWRTRTDGTATLEMPVDATSGFALQDLAPAEDGTWVVVFPGKQRGEVNVHTDCVGGLRGCAQTRQPGETCPAGWACDEGLACELPIGICGPLAGVGTCVPAETYCPEGGEAVCGCDGRTYSSDCDARLGGVPVLRTGACDAAR